MPTVDELVIKLKADIGNLESGLAQAKASISSLEGQVTGSTEKMNVATATFAERMNHLGESLSGVGHMGHQMMAVLDRMELSQLSTQSATDTVTNAQMRYNEAIAKYGERSREAVIAGNELERAQTMLERANIRANASFVMIGVSMVEMVPKVLAFTSTAVAGIRSVEWSVESAIIKIRAMAPELIVVSVIAGGLYYVWKKNTDDVAKSTEQLKTKIYEANNAVNEFRRNIETPPKRPSLMEQFEELTYFNPETGHMERRTPEQVERYKKYLETGIPGNILASPSDILGRIAPPPTIFDENRRATPLSVPSNLLRPAPLPQPSFSLAQGLISTDSKWGSMDSKIAAALDNNSKVFEKASKEPKIVNVTVNATINSNESPMQVFSDIGAGLGMGLDQNKIKVGLH